MNEDGFDSFDEVFEMLGKRLCEVMSTELDRRFADITVRLEALEKHSPGAQLEERHRAKKAQEDT